MKADKFIRRDMIYAGIFVIIGILSAITGFVFGFQKELMLGLTAGFLPTGLVMLIMYGFAKKRPTFKEKIEIQNEERNVYINMKAGHTAFWVSYWYIFIAVMLNNIIDISILHFLIITLLIMPVVYFTLVFIYHRKY